MVVYLSEGREGGEIETSSREKTVDEIGEDSGSRSDERRTTEDWLPDETVLEAE